MADEHKPNLKTPEELELDFLAYFRSVNNDKNISPYVCLSFESDTDFEKIPAGRDKYEPPVICDQKVVG